MSRCAGGVALGEDRRDGAPYAFGRGFCFPVADVCIAQSHPSSAVSQQTGYHRQRYASHYRVARECVTQIVQANVVDSGLAAHLAPERQIVRAGLRRITERGKDVWALCPRLTRQDGQRSRTQQNRARAGFAVRETKRVPIHLRPAQVYEFALSASGEQQQPDNRGLLPAGTSSLMSIQRCVQTVHLRSRQEPASAWARGLRLTLRVGLVSR